MDIGSPDQEGWQMPSDDEETPSVIRAAVAAAPRLPSSELFEDLALGPEQVTVVSAPYGFGKTTLLTEWFHRERLKGHRPRWFSAGAQIERRTMDRANMLDGALSAFVLDNEAEGDDLVLSRPITEPQLAARCEQVEAGDRLIFIDQAELLPEATIDYIIRFVGNLSGTPWRVVLASRSTIHPPLNDGRTVTTRRVGPADLQLSQNTVESILASGQPLLSSQARSQIVRRLDGWTIGVQLANVVLAEAPNPDEIAAAYCGRDIEISDLFETEIFGGLTRSEQEFLIQCSVLFELDPAGCDFVTREASSFDRLARLGRDHALLYARSDGLGYRWMPMARQFVLAKLEQRDASEVAVNRRRACQWYQAQSRYDDAVSQALTTDDWESLVQIILARGLETIADGDPEKVSAWLDRLPSQVLRTEGGLAILGAIAVWAISGSEENSTVDDWLAVAAANPASLAPCGAVSVHTAALTARALFGSSDAAERLGLARSALQEEAEGSVWAAMAHFALGQAAFFNDQPMIARQALSDCLRPTSPPSATVEGLLASSAASLLSLLEYESGETGRADLLLTMAELHHDAGAIGSGALALARANRAFRGGEPAMALEHMLSAGRSSRYKSMRILAFLNAAVLCAETGQPSESNACLEAADEYLADQPTTDRLLLRRRRAAEMCRQAADNADDQAASLTERELEVLRLLNTDLSRREIAAELYVSHNTVKTYVQRLYQKLSVSSRPAAVASAIQRGWLR